MLSTDRTRRLNIATVVLLALLAAILSVPGQASAHLPIYESGGNTFATAFKIPDISTSYGIFAQFDPHGVFGPAVQYYRFDGVQGREFYCSLSIPSLDYLKRFAPDLALVGPGLPTPDAENVSLLEDRGIALPAGDGMMRWVYEGANNSILPSETPNHGDFEPFTQTVLWARQEVTMQLPATGVFYVLVIGHKVHISPSDMVIVSGNEMKYVLAPGRAERFGIVDYMRMPVDWIETRLYWNENPLVFLSPTIATVIIGLVERWKYLGTHVFKGRRALHDMAFFLSLFTISGCLLMIGSGVNQLAYIVWNNGFAPLTSVVLVMLAVGALLGAVGIWRVGKPERMRNWVAVVFALIMAFVALVIGAGFLVGPLIFLSGTTLLVIAGSKNRMAGTSGT